LKGKHKDVETLSAFGSMNEETGLNNILRLNEIDEVYLVGLPYEYSVAATAEDALANGFKTYIVTDGCKPVGKSA